MLGLQIKDKRSIMQNSCSQGYSQKMEELGGEDPANAPAKTLSQIAKDGGKF